MWLVAIVDIEWCYHVGVARTESEAWDAAAEYAANSKENAQYRHWIEINCEVQEIELF